MRVLALGILMTAGLVGGAFAECPAGDEEALRWLDRMSHSLRETSYTGVFTYQHAGDVQAMRISHSVRGNMEREQITHLTGHEARVVRRQHPLDCIHPGNRLVRLGEYYRGSGEECGLSAHYRLQMKGAHRIAGRSAVIMNLIPRDGFRFGYQIALDRATGLLLKTQTVAGDGRVLERFQFAELSIGEPAMEGTKVDVIHEAAHNHGANRPPPLLGSPSWNVGWLPPGFTATDELDRTSHDKSFTDGLANFSVFVEELPELQQAGAGMARQGGTMAYTRGMLIAGRPALVTVLGEVPVETAQRVAESVSWAD